jgi:hypothetical protein
MQPRVENIGMDEFDVLMGAMKKQNHITILLIKSKMKKQNHITMFLTKSRSPYMVSS